MKATTLLIVGAGAAGVIYFMTRKSSTPTPTSSITCTSFSVMNDVYSYSFNATWINSGTISNTFTPSISSNGTVYPIATPVTLAPNQQYATGWVAEPVSAGTYTICPVPTGTGINCQTVTVSIGSV